MIQVTGPFWILLLSVTKGCVMELRSYELGFVLFSVGVSAIEFKY